MKRSGFVLIALALQAACLAACGCQKVVIFPERSMDSVAKAFGAAGAYDTNRDGLADFFTFADGNGRLARIAYDANGTGRPGAAIDLDAIHAGQSRHLAVILDGFGYEVAKEHYDAGGLRLFHVPSRVIAPYPSLTDPAIDDLLGVGPCPGYEAEYYDRAKNRVVGGTVDYLASKNMPYNRLLDYHAGVVDNAIHYVWPEWVYSGELDNLKRAFDQSKKRDFLAYLVSSAGMGTRLGKAGQLECLRELDRVLMQILWETRGQVKFTLMADHGHSYTPATRIPLEKALEAKGWRITDRLEKPKDVVYIRFGLETYAAFNTNSPKELAEDLIRAEGVELVSYAPALPDYWNTKYGPASAPSSRPTTKPAGADTIDGVVVLGRNDANSRDANSYGTAIVWREEEDCYWYGFPYGDPLRLTEVIQLYSVPFWRVEANDLMERTVDHYYPASLERLWRAHLGGQVQHPPDVIVSLEDRFYSGSQRMGSLVNIASTHGALNRRNSTAFVMSTAGPLPPYMRSREVRANVTSLLGRQWPEARQ